MVNMKNNIDSIRNDFKLVYEQLNYYISMALSSFAIIALITLILSKKSQHIDAFGFVISGLLTLGCLYWLIRSIMQVRRLIQFKNELIEHAKPYQLTSIKLYTIHKVTVLLAIYCLFFYFI